MSKVLFAAQRSRTSQPPPPKSKMHSVLVVWWDETTARTQATPLLKPFLTKRMLLPPVALHTPKTLRSVMRTLCTPAEHVQKGSELTSTGAGVIARPFRKNSKVSPGPQAVLKISKRIDSTFLGAGPAE